MVPQTRHSVVSNAIFDGAYELLRAVGRGRNSVVYQARRLASQQVNIPGPEIVALKVIVGNPKEPEITLRRMRRESLAMLACRHPNVIKVWDFVTSDELCYLAMEYAEEGDLRDLLEKRGMPLEFDFTCHAIQQVLSGLSAIHRAGIIHRDIKPENLLLTASKTVKIADFGVAYLPVEEPPMSDAASAVGTLDYLAPEVLLNQLSDTRADLFSVAVTFYQLLTNHLPYEEEGFTSQIERRMKGKPTPLSNYLIDTPIKGDEFFRKALAPLPEARFQTANEFADALAALASGTWQPAAEKIVSVPEFHLETPPPVSLEDNASTLISEENEIPELSKKEINWLNSDLERTVVAKKNVQLSGRTIFISALAVLFAVAGIYGLVRYLPLSGDRSLDKTSNEGSAISASKLDEKTARGALTKISALSGERVGYVEHLFADGSDVPLVVVRQDEERVAISLGLIGWEAVSVDALDFTTDSKLTVSGLGLKLLFTVSDNQLEQGKGIQGTYRELATGREGRWYLW